MADADIRPRGGGRLAYRLAASYFIILIFTFVILTGSFYFFLRASLHREAIRQLKRQGEALEKAYSSFEDKRGPLGDLKKREFFRLAGKLVVPGFFVLDEDNRVVATNLEKFVPVGTMINESALKNRRRINGRNFVTYDLPLVGRDGERIGTLVLAGDAGNIKAYNRAMMRILLYSLVISGALALGLGYFMASGITVPLRKLQYHIRSLAGRSFAGKISLKTGDELEDLAEAFNNMTARLKEYDEFQKEFFQNVSHDLKTPLMSIRAYAEGIKDGVFEGKEKEEGLNVIIKEAERLKSMVDDILYLSKLESIDDIYNFADIDLAEVVREAWEKAEVIGKRQGKDMKLQLSEARLPFRGDGEKLVNAFLNLLSNSIRHARSRVSLKVGVEGGRYKILIVDDGDGFKPDELNRVFRRFFRGEKGDSGLGLAIVKAVVEKHGGDIVARNSASGGAEFEIFFKAGSS